MKYILCYGDSNTWGCVPTTMERYDYALRWPGVMHRELGSEYHIYENAMNGRTTVFDDPIEEGRCGKTPFPVVLEACRPLDLVIIMLGSNDCKLRFNLQPWDIAWGMDLLVKYVKKAGCGRGGREPGILVMSPGDMDGDWEGTVHGTVFGAQARDKVRELAPKYQKVAQLNGVEYFDAAPHVAPGDDCVHWLPDSHERLGKAVAEKVRTILEK